MQRQNLKLRFVSSKAHSENLQAMNEVVTSALK